MSKATLKKTLTTRSDLKLEWSDIMEKYGVTLQDATDRFEIDVDADARDKGKPGEPGMCVFKRAATKKANVVAAFFGSQNANLIVKDKRGGYKALRYVLPKVMQMMIFALDNAQGKITLGRYVLRAPTKANSLKAKAARNKKAAEARAAMSEKEKEKARRETTRRRVEREERKAAGLTSEKIVQFRLRNFTGTHGYREAV